MTCANDNVSALGHSVFQLPTELHGAPFTLCWTSYPFHQYGWSSAPTCHSPVRLLPVRGLSCILLFVFSFIIAIYLSFLRFFLCVTSIFLPSFKCLFPAEQLVCDKAPALCSRGARFKSRLMSCLSETRYVCPRNFDGNILST